METKTVFDGRGGPHGRCRAQAKLYLEAPLMTEGLGSGATQKCGKAMRMHSSNGEWIVTKVHDLHGVINL